MRSVAPPGDGKAAKENCKGDLASWLQRRFGGAGKAEYASQQDAATLQFESTVTIGVDGRESYEFVGAPMSRKKAAEESAAKKALEELQSQDEAKMEPRGPAEPSSGESMASHHDRGVLLAGRQEV